MSNNVKSTHDFYADLRTLLQTGSEQKVGPRVGGMSMGVGRGGGGRSTEESATPQTVLVRKQQVDIAQTRALKSLKELAKRNQEAERRAKATVHAVSSKYLKMLEQNPDIPDGDPLFFFGHGLECMEDIIYAGFCQVNTSVNLYLEEIDTRFNNLLVMAEEIDKAMERVKQLREEAKEEARQIETRQQTWLDQMKQELREHWSQLLKQREKLESDRLKEIEKSNRWIKGGITALVVLVLLLGSIDLLFLFRQIL
jgi:ElaB/YqjD/DUF883 family membrane-anchored ribosome-binding protein